MMKFLLHISFLLLFPWLLKAQAKPFQVDSLQKILKDVKNDSVRMDIYDKLGWYFAEINRDSALAYFEKGLPIARKLALQMYEADALNGMGYVLGQLGNYPKSLECYLAGIKIARDPAIEKNAWNLANNAWNTSGSTNPANARLDLLGWILDGLGSLYGSTGNMNYAISNTFEAKTYATSVRDTTLLEVTNSHLGHIYFELGKLDSALHFQQTALRLYQTSDVFKKYEGSVLSAIGLIYQQQGDFQNSKDAFLKSLRTFEEQKNLSGLARTYLSLSHLYDITKIPDSSMFYALKALETFKKVSSPSGISSAYRQLSSTYDKFNNRDSAFVYLKLAIAISDSLNNVEKTNLLAFKNKDFSELMRLKESEAEKIKTQTKIKMYALLAGIGVFILITLMLYRNNKQRQRANALLQQQKEEIEIQKKNAEDTLSELKATQAQLIQSEKMASLGELTAGIAHEIQNPLNFINNFSEVNKELADELEKEIDKENYADAKVIAKDIKDNEEKINHHGKRADAIVKGMLQHSRKSEGKKELTDINALCDEYLRLAYHGLRAKDKSFNAQMKADYDDSIRNINIVPQDIGRVILNLITNAFYAVNEKVKSKRSKVNEENGRELSAVSYEPMVTVQTKKLNDKIEINVSDNGNGVPDAIKEKIFQPFFTTKPTGQGTGLGLSLSYDIIKVHSGELKMETKEGEGTEFKILLPYFT